MATLPMVAYIIGYMQRDGDIYSLNRLFDQLPIRWMKNGEKLILFPLDSFFVIFPFRNPKETKLTFGTNQK